MKQEPLQTNPANIDTLNKDVLIFYKLIVLYMLNRAAFPITKAQVADFILEKEYMDFFTLQQVFAELSASEMISTKSIRNRTHLAITEEGRETLYLFQNRISSSTREKIDAFFRENAMEMRNEVSILADYYKSTSGEYEAHLTASERISVWSILLCRFPMRRRLQPSATTGRKKIRPSTNI